MANWNWIGAGVTAGGVALAITASAALESEQLQHVPTPAAAIPAPSLSTSETGTMAEPAPAARAPEPSEVEAPGYPDLTQTNPALGLPGGGSSHCGPVSASNSVMFLGNAGFDRLLPLGATPEKQQAQLVGILASRSYMGTDQHNGTGANGILRGLERYLKRADYPVRQLAYQGWRGHQRRFRTGIRRPQLGWIRDALADGGIALINVGWYRQLVPTKTYVRRGGHWLTVTGTGKTQSGTTDPLALTLHDPAPYAGDEASVEHVTATRIDEGWIIPQANSINSFPAKGYYLLGGGMHTKREKDVAIIDGAITLVLEPRAPEGS